MPEKKNKSRRGKGEGGLYFSQARDEWVGSFYTEEGQRKYVYGKKRSEANAKLQKAQREYEQGLLITSSKQTVKQYLEHWLENVHKPTLRLGTYRGYRIYLDNHILPELGYLPLQKLAPEHIEAFYAKKQQGENKLAPKTIHNIHGLLHKALANAVRRNLVLRNVCDTVSLPRKTRHEIQPFTKEQAQQLREAAQRHILEELFLLAITTGMREGELLALRWKDIDLAHQSLQIRRSMSYIPGKGYVEFEPKTPKGRRKLVLLPFVCEKLKQHRTHQFEVRLKAGAKWHDRDLVFCNRYGGFLDPSHLRQRFHKFLRDAHLPDVRFHDLRHSAASLLLSMGIPAKVVQEILGHSQISMTMDIYSHMLPGMQEEAMGKMDDLFREDHEDDFGNGNLVQ